MLKGERKSTKCKLVGASTYDRRYHCETNTPDVCHHLTIWQTDNELADRTISHFLDRKDGTASLHTRTDNGTIRALAWPTAKYSTTWHVECVRCTDGSLAVTILQAIGKQWTVSRWSVQQSMQLIVRWLLIAYLRVFHNCDSISIWQVNCNVLLRTIRQLRMLWAAWRRADWLHIIRPFSIVKNQHVHFLSHARMLFNHAKLCWLSANQARIAILIYASPLPVERPNLWLWSDQVRQSKRCRSDAVNCIIEMNVNNLHTTFE